MASAIKGLGRTLLLCASCMTLSACILKGTKPADKPNASNSSQNSEKSSYKVNSGLDSVKPPALRAAQPAKPTYSARPDLAQYNSVTPPLPNSLPLAPTSILGNPFKPATAMRRAQNPLEKFSPIPEIIATTPKFAKINDAFPLALRLAPKTIKDKGPMIEKAPLPAKAVVHLDPSLIEKGHFKRPIKPYDTLGRMTAEPIRPNVETFRQAIAASYNNDPSLKAERVRVKETDEGYIQARALGRLTAQIDGTVSYDIQNVPIRGDLTLQGNAPRNAQLQVTQPLYQGGRVKALKKQAKIDIVAAREALKNAEQTTALAVGTAYSDVIRDRELANIRREDLRLVLKQKKAAEDRYEIGIGTTTDIFQAESRVGDAEINLARSQAQLAISFARYDRLVGHPPLQLASVPRLNIPNTLAEAKAISKRNNPRLRSLVNTFDSAFYNIDAAKAAGRPTLALTGFAAAERGQQTGLSQRDDATIALQLRVPLYSGGLNKSTVRQARLGKDRLYYEVLDTERAIDEALSDIWSEYKANLKNLNETRMQISAAQKAYEGVREEQVLGQRTILDVLDSERELQQTKANLVSVRRNLDVAKFELLTIMGVFDAQHLALPVALYNPQDNLNTISKNKYSARRAKNIIKDWINPNPASELDPAWP